MNITFHPSFQKFYKKRIADDPKLVEQTKERITMFQKNSQHPLLRDHKLKGTMSEFRAFWITGDIRIVYEEISEEEVVFYDIGTHNQIY